MALRFEAPQKKWWNRTNLSNETAKLHFHVQFGDENDDLTFSPLASLVAMLLTNEKSGISSVKQILDREQKIEAVFIIHFLMEVSSHYTCQISATIFLSAGTSTSK